jgi:TRAP transporter TAXI family solute receptor
MARRRRPRLSWGIIAWLLGLTVIGAAAGLYNFAKLTYRVAVGPEGGESQRIFAAINPVFAMESSFIHLVSVPTRDPQATAKALEAGEVDLAIIRPDLAVPSNGRTIAILRREPVLLIVPASGKIEKVADLKGKAIGLVKGSALNGAILDRILNYYEVPEQSVQRVELSANEVAGAVKQKRVAAFFVVGPVGQGVVTDVVATITKAGNGAPDFLAVEEAEAIAKRNPALEKLEIARGALQGSPAVPDESITTLAVTRRLVARASMFDWPAGEIARLLFSNKSKITAELPFAYQMEAPDTDKDAILPAHSGVAAYVNGEQKSLYDTFESLFWMGWMLCTLVGVSYAALRSRLNRSKHDATADATDRVLEMLSETRGADAKRLDTLGREADRLMQWSLQGRANDAIDEERFQFLTLALGQVHQAIERQRQRSRERVLEPSE